MFWTNRIVIAWTETFFQFSDFKNDEMAVEKGDFVRIVG